MVSMASNMSLAEKSAQLRSKNIPPKLTIPQSPSNKDLPNAPRDYSITTKGISHYTPEKIGEILHILGEALVGASVIGKKISDQGRIVRCVQEIQVRLALPSQVAPIFKLV